MTPGVNAFGQCLGTPLPGWRPPPFPGAVSLAGRFCRLERLNPDRHAAELHAANASDDGRLWTYLPYGPFADLASYSAWMERHWLGQDPLLFSIVDAVSGRALGMAGYLRIDPGNGSIEVGHLAYPPSLQRSPAATEAMYLLMAHAFGLGYRRYEWKCNALNEPSRAAALRLGFTFEGLFRQAAVVKGHNRDTTWYSLLDSEWPVAKAAFEAWLAPENFGPDGRQRRRLADLRAALANGQCPPA
jgi:RimJ/RimL family protein N-acetyltransferase